MNGCFAAGVCLLLGFCVHAAEFRLESGEPLSSARDRVRAARDAGRISLDEKVVVTVPDGVYRLTSTLEFGNRDSGTEVGPVVWRSEAPGGARLRGGVVLGRERFRPIADGDPLWRTFRAEARERIVVTDVSDVFKKPLGPWPDNGPTRQFQIHPGPSLFLGDELLPLARYPDAPRIEGTEHQLFDYEKGFLTFARVGEGRTNDVVTKDGVIVIDDERPSCWDFSRGIWGNGYWACDWSDSFELLRQWNPQTHQLKVGSFKELWRPPAGRPRRFFFLNLPEELTSPGEWYLDRERRRLYYVPLDGVAGDLVLTDLQKPLLRIDGASNLSFEGFSFECTHTSGHNVPAVVIQQSTNCVVRGGRIAMHANLAGRVVDGRDCGFENLEMYTLGGSGIEIEGGNRKALLPARNFAERVTVSRFSLLKRCFCPAITIGRKSCGNAIRHCEVAFSPYIAVVFHGNENVLADNDLHDLVRISEDSGAVYSGHDPCSMGNLVIGNSFRDVGVGPIEKRGVVRYMGIYFDDCDWGDWLVGNRFERTGTAMFIGGGNLFHFHNNLAVRCSGGFHLDERGVDWQPRSFGADKKTGVGYFERCWQEYDYRNAPWSVAYPEAVEVLDDHPEQPVRNFISGNVVADCWRNISAPPAIRARFTEPYWERNEFLTNHVGRLEVPQPVQLDEAVDNAFASSNGEVRVEVGLDRSARFSWRVTRGGRTVVALSPLSLTVDARDYGRYVVPRNAEGPSIPLVDIVTGRTVAFFEVKVRDDSVSWRWRVPGAGRRRINGENSAWIFEGGTPAFDIELPANPRQYRGEPYGRYPVRYERAANAWSLSFPDAPRGWMVEGEIVTPWRVTTLKAAD